MTGDEMIFPDTFDEFADTYGLVDTEEVYTNGSQLIPVFRVKQWLEHINVLSENKEDLISRQRAIDAFEKFIHELGIEDDPYNYGEMALSVQNVPSVENKGASRHGRWLRMSDLPKMKTIGTSVPNVVT